MVEETFKQLTAEKFPKIMKDITPQICELQGPSPSPAKKRKQKHTPNSQAAEKSKKKRIFEGSEREKIEIFIFGIAKIRIQQTSYPKLCKLQTME